MKRETLCGIAAQLHFRLQRQDTVTRPAIPVMNRVAITICRLTNITSYLAVGVRFGVGLSTIAALVIEVCLAMELDLLRRTVTIGAIQSTHLHAFQRWMKCSPHQQQLFFPCLHAYRQRHQTNSAFQLKRAKKMDLWRIAKVSLCKFLLREIPTVSLL